MTGFDCQPYVDDEPVDVPTVGLEPTSPVLVAVGRRDRSPLVEVTEVVSPLTVNTDTSPEYKSLSSEPQANFRYRNPAPAPVVWTRSEERRVGKECRSRWA